MTTLCLQLSGLPTTPINIVVAYLVIIIADLWHNKPLLYLYLLNTSPKMDVKVRVM